MTAPDFIPDDSPDLVPDDQVFGAPGTTATDRKEGIFSSADISVKDSKTKQPSLSLASNPPVETPDFISDKNAPDFIPDDAPIGNKNPKGDLLESAKAAGREFEAAADTIASMPGFIMKLGAVGIADIGNSIKSLSSDSHMHSTADVLKETSGALEQFNQTKVGQFLDHPISYLLGNTKEVEGTIVSEAFQNLGKYIQGKADTASAANNDEAYGEVIKRSANIAMALIGSDRVIKAVSKLKPKPAEPKFSETGELPITKPEVVQDPAAESRVKETVPETPTPDDTGYGVYSKALEEERPVLEDHPDVTRDLYNNATELKHQAPATVEEIRKYSDEAIKDWDGQNKLDNQLVMQGTELLKKLEPKQVTREGHYDKIDNGTADPENLFVKTYRDLSDAVFEKAHFAGVVGSYIENYITHMYDFGRQADNPFLKSLYKLKDSLDEGGGRGSGMSSKSKFSKERTFAIIDEAAKKMGLVPLTKDPMAVYNIYATSMLKAVNNKKLIGELSEMVPDGMENSLIAPLPKDGNMPKDYTTVNSPQLIGKMIHKSIADTITSIYENYNPSKVVRIASSISALAKMATFSFSGFHLKSLLDASLGGIRTLKSGSNMIGMFKEWKLGQGEGVVKDLLRGGLEIGHPPVDVAPHLVETIFKEASQLADKLVPGLGRVIELPYKFQQGLNHILWNVVHPSFKLNLAGQEYARLMKEGIEPKQAAEMASTFANDILGGLNWKRLALNADTDLGRSIANTVASKRGQSAIALAFLAPDWGVATGRSWLGALRKGQSPKEKLMYIKYLTQSAIIYYGLANTLNYYFVGKPISKNSDPTYVDMGRGRKMQLNKHFMEGLHWITDPGKTLSNKIGPIPSEVIEQMTNKKWISPNGAPAITTAKPKDPLAKRLVINSKDRLVHTMKKFVPISVNTTVDQSPEQALGGFVGTPIYEKAKH